MAISLILLVGGGIFVVLLIIGLVLVFINQDR